MATHELWLTDPKGTRLRLLDDALYLQAARVVNRIAPFELHMPATFPDSLLKPDYMVQVWRAPDGGRLGLWRCYFLRKWRLARAADGTDQVRLYGPCQNDLLRRRIVAYYAGAAESTYTAAPADDIMKYLVTTSILNGIAPAPAAGTRVWDNLSVGPYVSAGPAISKSVAWKKLLTKSGEGALAEVAAAASQAGTEVFFDIVPATVSSTAITFEFRTWTGQPGQDVSDRVLFSAEDETLREPYLEEDYTDEENYIYAGGQGEGEEREIQQVYEASRYNASIFNRCEGFADARNEEAPAAVADKGEAVLHAGRPRIRAGGKLVDSAGQQFGLHWDVGYRVRAQYRTLEWDGIVRAGVLTLEDNRETIDARMDYES